MFYDLTELQRHANRLYGFSAQKTLDIAQALYETYKLISYGSIPGDVFPDGRRITNEEPPISSVTRSRSLVLGSQR